MPNSPDSARRSRSFPLLPEYTRAAEVWLEADGALPAVTPVDAAGIILLRDSPEGVETYVSVHARRSPFGPVAFPGGPVDALDDEPLPWIGPTSIEWGRRWGDDVGTARRAVVGAVRELFEMTGILLAGPDKYSIVETGDGRDWFPARERVRARDLSLRELVETRYLKVRTDVLWPVARWTTPEFLHRRFDTRYFAVILPERQAVTELPADPRPGLWVPVRRLTTHLSPNGSDPVPGGAETRPDTWLGDTLGSPITVGKQQAELIGASMSSLLHDLASARSVVEVIARPYDLAARTPRLGVEADGGYRLETPARAGRRPRSGGH